jgi:nitrate reductase gamma subunit
MNYADFLLWVRGDAFHWSLAIFVFGVTLRLLEIILLGRKTNLAEKRGSGVAGGVRTIFSRFVPNNAVLPRTINIVVAGYVFHIGLFISILFFAPHIVLFEAAFGFSWYSLPNAVIDFATIMAILGLIALLINRLTNPVLRLLTGFGDWLVWFVTLLPLVTGFMTFHHLVEPYPLMLALHILSVELLLIVFPFTKLMHTFTLFLARYYTGENAGHRGVEI